MKILFLNYEYPPLGGGAAQATEAILREWAKADEHEVHLVTAALGQHLEHIRLGGNVYVHRLPIRKNPQKLHSQSVRDIIVYTLRAAFFLSTFVRTERNKKPFDATLTFFTVPCGFLAYGVKLLFGIPYVVSLRGADVPGFSEKYDTFYLFAKPLIRFLWRQARAVIPNSAGLAELARETAPEQSWRIIENGVDTEAFQPDPTKRLAEPIIFLSTSRLTPRKGMHHLIEAFAMAVKKSVKEMELHLIGEGEQRSALERRVKELGLSDRVKFIGRVEHEHLPRHYQGAHVFVLPSKNEGMSNSALEALASGLPLMVSSTGGMRELVADGENGLLIDPENIASFAEAMLRLAGNQELMTRLGNESRRRAKDRNWSAVAAQFVETLTQAKSRKQL